MNDEGLRDEINKRLTLNWLIQGAAQHAGMTFQHLVRKELDALDPRLVRLYDQYALINLLQRWHLGGILAHGLPQWFWWRAATSRRHPFSAHPILSRYGGMLAKVSRQRAHARCWEKRFAALPVLFSYHALFVIANLRIFEAPHYLALVELAKQTASSVWGIEIDRLDANLVSAIESGDLFRSRTARATSFSTIVGYGRVVRRGGQWIVVSRGTNWQLVAKELVKGTAELVCLHGLNTLSDETYHRVIDAADRIEFEPWMLQTGGELWRRLLAVIPPGVFLAAVLMRLARLPAKSLESLILAVIERPDTARLMLEELCRDIHGSNIESKRSRRSSSSERTLSKPTVDAESKSVNDGMSERRPDHSKVHRATWVVFSFVLGIMKIHVGFESLLSGSQPYLALGKIICGVVFLILFLVLGQPFFERRGPLE